MDTKAFAKQVSQYTDEFLLEQYDNAVDQREAYWNNAEYAYTREQREHYLEGYARAKEEVKIILAEARKRGIA